jgi:hypothetical protein
MPEQSHREEMNAVIRAQRERQAARSNAPPPPPLPQPPPPPEPQAEPTPPQNEARGPSMFDRFRRRR